MRQDAGQETGETLTRSRHSQEGGDAGGSGSFCILCPQICLDFATMVFTSCCPELQCPINYIFLFQSIGGGPTFLQRYLQHFLQPAPAADSFQSVP